MSVPSILDTHRFVHIQWLSTEYVKVRVPIIYDFEATKECLIMCLSGGRNEYLFSFEKALATLTCF